LHPKEKYTVRIQQRKTIGSTNTNSLLAHFTFGATLSLCNNDAFECTNACARCAIILLTTSRLGQKCKLRYNSNTFQQSFEMKCSGVFHFGDRGNDERPTGRKQTVEIKPFAICANRLNRTTQRVRTLLVSATHSDMVVDWGRQALRNNNNTNVSNLSLNLSSSR
jgi:hypothetical protein